MILFSSTQIPILLEESFINAPMVSFVQLSKISESLQDLESH